MSGGHGFLNRQLSAGWSAWWAVPGILFLTTLLTAIEVKAQNPESEAAARRHQEELARQKMESEARRNPKTSRPGKAVGRHVFNGPFQKSNAEATVVRPVYSFDEAVIETLDWMIQEFGSAISPFSDSLPNVEMFSENGKFGFRTFDQKKVKIPAELDLVWAKMFEHSYVVHKDGLAGTVNVNGDIAIPLVYATLTPFFAERPDKFSNRYYHFNKNINSLLIDKTLCRYIAQSKNNGRFGVIDAYNRLVVPFEYDTIFVHSGFNRKDFLNEKVLNLVKDGITIVYDCHFKPLIPASEQIEELVTYNDLTGANYLFEVKKGGLVGVYYQGAMIIPPLYQRITPLSLQPKGAQTSQIQFFVRRPDSLWGLVDFQHRVILPFNHQALSGIGCLPGLRPLTAPGYYHYSAYSKQKWQLIHVDGHLLAEFSDIIPKYFIPGPIGEDYFYAEPIGSAAPEQFFYCILSPKGEILHRFKKDYAIFQLPGKDPAVIASVAELEKKYGKQRIVCYFFDRELQRIEQVLLSDGQLMATQ